MLSHAESIALLLRRGVGFIPEFKAPSVPMPFDGMSQGDYADRLVAEYRAAGVAPARVWLQSFDLEDIRHWIRHDPAYGAHAIYLDGRYREPRFDHRRPSTWHPDMEARKAQGVAVIAPPLWMLLATDAAGAIVPSVYAEHARRAGLGIVPWALECSGPLSRGGGRYYRTVRSAIARDCDVLTVLDVLVRKVGVRGVFSDWPATVTYYASCVGAG